jgi:hypothetical protein
MLETIISGGQPGVGLAAWRVAAAYRVPTGGWMPRGFLTEEGPRPEFAARYGARELAADETLAQTRSNVRDSDGTLWFGETTTREAWEAVAACQELGKPCLTIYPGAAFRPAHVVAWIDQNRVRTLHVAGNRERDEPGLGERVEAFLVLVLEELGHARP